MMFNFKLVPDLSIARITVARAVLEFNQFPEV